MAQRKPDIHQRSQRQQSIDEARELGAEHSDAIFMRARENGARASGAKGKKGANDA